MMFGLFRFFLLFVMVVSAAPTIISRDESITTARANKQHSAYFGTRGEGPVSGVIEFRSNGARPGVTISLNLSFKDSSIGPFAYHVHVDRVPGDKNCSKTGSHFDPFKPKEPRLVCDQGNPAACEVGDLSGKHSRIPQYPDGSITVTSMYKDAFVSLDPENAAFIGNRSIVIHKVGGDRIACANLVASG